MKAPQLKPSMFERFGLALKETVYRTTIAAQQLELDSLRKRVKARGFHDEANTVLVNVLAETRIALGAGKLGARDETTLEAAVRVVAEREDLRLAHSEAHEALKSLVSHRAELEAKRAAYAADHDNARALLAAVRKALDPDSDYPAQSLDVLATRVRRERDSRDEKGIDGITDRERETARLQGGAARDLVRLVSDEALDYLETENGRRLRFRIDSTAEALEADRERVERLAAKLRCVRDIATHPDRDAPSPHLAAALAGMATICGLPSTRDVDPSSGHGACDGDGGSDYSAVAE